MRLENFSQLRLFVNKTNKIIKIKKVKQNYKNEWSMGYSIVSHISD